MPGRQGGRQGGSGREAEHPDPRPRDAFPSETTAWDASADAHPDAIPGDRERRLAADAGRSAAQAPDVPASDAQHRLQPQATLRDAAEPYRPGEDQSGERSSGAAALGVQRGELLVSQPLVARPEQLSLRAQRPPQLVQPGLPERPAQSRWSDAVARLVPPVSLLAVEAARAR